MSLSERTSGQTGERTIERAGDDDLQSTAYIWPCVALLVSSSPQPKIGSIAPWKCHKNIFACRHHGELSVLPLHVIAYEFDDKRDD